MREASEGFLFYLSLIGHDENHGSGSIKGQQIGCLLRRSTTLIVGSEKHFAQFKMSGLASTPYAGVAQLVERNLAKVEVESSRLFSRSILT